MTVRAKVRRDGPGEWSWTLEDEHGDIVTGLAGSWPAALGEVTDELRLLDEVNQPPGVEIPIVGTPPADWRDLDSPAARMWGPDVERSDPRPSWRRWLGL